MIAESFETHRYYESASNTKHSFKGWEGGKALLGDQESITAQKPILDRAWDLFRNNPTTNSILNTKSNNVIGTGLKVSPAIDHETIGIDKDEAKKKNAQLAKLFYLWANNEASTTDRKNNFYMLQMRVYQNFFISGDCFAVLRDNSVIDKSRNYPFNLTIEGVDAQMVRNPNGTMNTFKLSGGIEVNKYNEEIAYHFMKVDENNLEYRSLYNYETVRIPKYGKNSNRRNVLHVHMPVRFNERRGVSMFAPVMEHIKQLKRYEDSELMATVISSFFTAFITTDSGQELQYENIGDDPTLGSGTMAYLKPGEGIELVNPNRPNPNFEAFENAYWDKICSSVGLSPEMCKNKYESSYTAARAALLQVYQQTKIDRVGFNFLFNQPIYEEFVTEMVLRGKIDLEGYLIDPLKKAAWLKTTWVGDAMGMIDPIKEVTAAEKMRDNQWKTSDQIARELTGNNYADILEAAEDEKQDRLERDMELPGEYDRKTERLNSQRMAEDSEESETTDNNDNNSDGDE